MTETRRSMKRVKAQHGYAVPIAMPDRRRKRKASENKPRARTGKAIPHPLAAQPREG